MKITRRQLRQIIRESIREEAGALREISLVVGSGVAIHLANRLKAMEDYVNANPEKIPSELRMFRNRILRVTNNREAVALIQRAQPYFERLGIDIFEL